MVDVHIRFSLFAVLRVLDDYDGQPAPRASVQAERGVPAPLRKNSGIFAFKDAPGESFSVTVTAAFREPAALTLSRGEVCTVRLRPTEAFALPMEAAGVSGIGTPDGMAAMSPLTGAHRIASAERDERRIRTAGMPHPALLGAPLFLYDARENRGEICTAEDIVQDGYLLVHPLQNHYHPERSRVCRLHTAICNEFGNFYLPVPAAEKVFFWPDMSSEAFPRTVALAPGRMCI